MARHPITRALALASLGCACVTNSPGNYRGVPIDSASPVAEFRERLREPGRDRELEREALWHLEDLVEDAASRLCGREVDYPTPSLTGPTGSIEILDRSPDSPEEARLSGYFGSALYGLDLLGMKYLVDHLGPRFSQLEDVEAARAACGAVERYVAGQIPRDEALEELRKAEGALCADLGLAESELARMERRYDSAVSVLYASTHLEGDEPRIRVCVPTMTLDARNAVRVYAHELMHCIAISSHPVHPVLAFVDPRNQSPELLALQELGAEAFAELVVADLTERGLLEPEAAGSPSVGLPEAEARQQNLRELERRLERLRSLYRDSTLEFAAIRELSERYGQVAAAQDPGRTSALISDCIRALGADGFSRRMWSLTGFADLERLRAECAGREDAALAATSRGDSAQG